MKTLKNTITTLGILILTASTLLAQEQLAVPLSNPGEPGTLHVSVVRGSITVTGYDGDEVLIDYAGEEQQESREVTRDGLRRISSNSLGFEVTEDDNVVQVSGVSPMKQVSFNISVPRSFGLKLSTVNGGGLNVENVTGEMELSNVNGKITLNNVGGSAVANTVNGDITATFNSVAGDKPMSFTNLNGDIDVTYPANVQMTAKMKSEWGDVFTDFDMDINRTSENRMDQDSNSHDGAYRISINNWINGSINGGGPEYTFRSMRGDIYIRRQ